MAADAESTIRIGIDTTEALASIKNLQAQIAAFHTQLQSSGNAANAALSGNLQRALINNLNATGQFAASLTTVKSSAESFTTALEKNKLSMGEYFRYAGGASKTFGRLFKNEFDLIEKVARERVKVVNTQFIKMGRNANGAIEAIKVRPLVADLDSLAGRQAIAAQKQQVLNQLLKQGSTNLLNFGKNTQWAGRQLMVGFTVPLAYLGTVAGKTFMQMEEQALRFKRVYGELFTTQDETDKMVGQIQDLAREFTKYGIAVEKTMSLAADVAAMGKMGADLTAQVTEATRLAVLGGVEQEKALEATISITNAFGTATEDLAKKINFLNAVENQTVTSIEDLTIAIPKAGPVVKQLGGDVEDLAFFLTAMKEGGINASEGANALKSGLASLINPTDKAAKFLEGFGINLRGIVEANKGDVKGIVIDFAKALDTLDPLSRARSIEQLFGKFQFSRLSTLFQNVTAEGNQASRVLKLTRNATEELAILSERELKRVEDSTGYKFKKALEDLKATLVPLGEQFLKIITPVAEFATKILGEFNKLSEGSKSAITTIIAVLGGIGPVALMTFGLMANGVANLIKLFSNIKLIIGRFTGAVTGSGSAMSYMTTEQLEAAAAAASLDQTHSQLIQTFTLEKTSIEALTRAYEKAIAAQSRYNVAAAGRGPVKRTNPKGYNKGVISVPGPKGAGDIVPAMLSPGEAVIPAKMASRYSGFISDMISGNLPEFSRGVFLGMPRSGKSTRKNREAATEIFSLFKQSSYANVPPTQYGHQIAPTTGHSFPIFGLGGVYAKPDGSKVFVKPVMDEAAALAEMRATEIARKVHGLKAPEQKIVVIADPQDPTRQRRFLALESKLDETFVNAQGVGKFTEGQYFKQLVASLLRADKDLSASNVFGNVVADVGPAGVFSRASGLRSYADKLPSMEEQAMINLLGVKGGARKAFAESTVGLMANLTPQQYHKKMIEEIKRALPLLEKTVADFKLSSPAEIQAYNAMIQRLRDGLNVDWSKFHAIHSAVKPPKPTQSTLTGYNSGVVSVPGPKGAGDVVPAMLSPGEAVIPAKMASKYRGLISGMIAGNIPGFIRGIENVGGQSDRTAIEKFASRFESDPKLNAIMQATFDEMLASGQKITKKSFDERLKDRTGTLFNLAGTTARFSDLSGSGSSVTGLNATHGNAPLTITPQQATEMASRVSGRVQGKLLEAAATGRNSTALSNLVFGMPAAFNRQDTLMSGKDAGQFVKKFPKLFMEPIIAMYGKKIEGLSSDDLGIKQFTDTVAKRLTAAGKKAVTEGDFYKIIKDSIGDLKAANPNSPALKALEKARDTFRVLQLAGQGGRREVLTGGQVFNSKGKPVVSAGAPSYRDDASRAAIRSGTQQADEFVTKILNAAAERGSYLTDAEPKAAAKATRAPKAPAGKPSNTRKVAAKKFPGGFDPNRLISKADSRGRILYSYLDENGKAVRVAKVDVAKAMGVDEASLRKLEAASAASVDDAVAQTKSARSGRFGKAAGIAGLVATGAMMIPSVLPANASQGGEGEQGAGIDLTSAAIIGSTALSIPMMFGKSIPEFFRGLASWAKALPKWGKIVAILAAALAAATPAITKAFTPLKDTEEYTDAFNDGLVNNRQQLDAIATTFGRVASGDIYERVRQNKFTPLSYAPGQTPFGETFVASEQGKIFVEEYRKALADAGPQAAVAKLSQELSYGIASGIFTVDQARSIAMTIGQQLDDMSIGMNVSANITGLFGPDGKKLESNTGDVLSSFITNSGQPLQTLLGNEENFAGAAALNLIDGSLDSMDGYIKIADRFLGLSPIFDSALDGLKILGPVVDGISQLFGIGLDAGQVGSFVSATMSTVEAGRQSLATFELIYDEKEATVQKEIDHARAIKDTAAEAKALEKLEKLQSERVEKRIELQKALAKQLQAAEDIYAKTTSQGRSDILSGFMDQFTALYKDSPLASVAESIKTELDRLKDNPFVVNIAAALATGAIKPDSFNALLDSLEGKPLETNILANLSTVIKSQGTQAGGELVTMLNKLAGRSDLQLTLSVLVKQDAAYLDLFSLMSTLPGGEDVMAFYLDPKINPNNLKDLNALKGNLDEIDQLIKTGDFNMENLLKLDIDLNESEFDALKANAEWFDKLPEKQKKVFTTVFLSVLPTITSDQIDAEIQRQAAESGAAAGNPIAGGIAAQNTYSKLNTTDQRAKIAAKLAADYAKSLIDYLDLTDTTTGGPTTPTDDKKQTSFLDAMVKRVRDLFKATQKLTTGWTASKNALQGLNAELGGNIGKLFGGEGLAEKLRNAGVAESLIPGLMDLKDTDPKRFAEFFVGGKVSGGLSQFGQLANNIQIAADAVESFANTQSRAAAKSRQQQVAVTRLIGLGVSYSDALEMVEDDAFLAMVSTERFNDEVLRQIGLFNEAKKAAAGTLEGMTAEFEEAFSGAMDRFAAEEEAIDIQLRIDTADDEALIASVQEKIAKISDQNDDLNYGLDLLVEQEDIINKTYDDRLEALDEVEKANARIAAQQQRQINLAQAIAEGDVFAAAKAMQDLEQTNAEGFSQSSRDLLERERSARLEALTVDVMVNGEKKKLTRLEIEELIKKNTAEIAKIEEEQLEPAERRVRIATALAEEAKRGLEIADKTKLEWEQADNKIKLASLSVTAYDGKLATALASVEKIVKAWKDVKDAQDAAGGGAGGSGGSNGAGTPAANMTEADAKRAIDILRKDNLPAAQKELADLGNIEERIANADRYARNMANQGKMLEAKSALDKRDAWQKQLDAAKAKIKQITDAIDDLKKKFNLTGYATGGSVNGKGTATSDSIPAMLSNGEYVVRASSVNKLGVDFLDFINKNGSIPGFAKGGSADRPSLSQLMASTKKTVAKVVAPAVGRAQAANVAKMVNSSIPTANRSATMTQAFEQYSNANKYYGNAPAAVSPKDTKNFFKELASPNTRVVTAQSAEAAKNILRDKSFRTTFTNNFRGLTTNAQSVRPRAESQLLGIKENINPALRPLYGALTNPNLAAGYKALGLGATDTYGPVKFMLPNSVKNRTTFTLGDSLSDARATPGSAVPLNMLKKPTPGQFMKMGSQGSATEMARGNMYLEAQVLGGATRMPRGTTWTYVDPARGPINRQNLIGGGNLTRSINTILDISGGSKSSMKRFRFADQPNLTNRQQMNDFRSIVKETKNIVKNDPTKRLPENFSKFEKLTKRTASLPKLPKVFGGVSRVLGPLGYLSTIIEGGRIMQGTSSMLPKLDPMYAMGGLVRPKYFNYGGVVKKFAKGGDVVPSMLTPGEFVMSRYAVQNYGLDKMNALNSGTYNTDSVYNYQVNVNVKSDANADDIARSVMMQIKQIESQRIRGAR